jgi:hypothetical protein
MHNERGTRAGAANDRERQDSGGANYYPTTAMVRTRERVDHEEICACNGEKHDML